MTVPATWQSAVAARSGPRIGCQPETADSTRQTVFADVYDRYARLHDMHMKKLRLTVVSGLPLDVTTFNADADELKAARDALYASVRPCLHRGVPFLGSRHEP